MARSIIITGASAGIGRETAARFLAAGWQVGLIARRRKALEELAAGNPNAHVLPADVTDADAVDGAFDAFVARAGRLDVLFNNAGIFVPGAVFDEIPLADWQQSVDVNLTGMFLCARKAFSIMRRQDPQGGRIINNGSVSAQAPRPNSAPYTATKHAITGLTKAISLDGRPFDIACGQIDIGNAATEMVRNLSKRKASVTPDGVPEPVMDVALVADAVYRMADLPLSANVLQMTLMATKMQLVGRG